MSITREELKVGEKYLDTQDKKLTRKVLMIGEKSLFYSFNRGGILTETSWNIGAFCESSNIIPKPKKKIKLIGYIDQRSGVFLEYVDSGSVPGTWKKVSERVIEVDDEN